MRTIDVKQNKIVMKYVAFFFLAALAGCSSDDDKAPETRCLFGVEDDGSKIVIGCATREQYLAGSQAFPQVELYDHVEWTECGNCK